MREFNPIRCAVQSKKAPRPELTGVFYDNGYKIGTNGHIMAIVKSDYPSHLEGKIIAKDGSVINKCRYPNYKSAIPLIKECKKFAIDTLNLKDAIDKANYIKKENPLTYIGITSKMKATVEAAQLILSFIKGYKIKEVYINKKETVLLFTDSDNTMLYMGIDGKINGAEVITNQIITKL